MDDAVVTPDQPPTASDNGGVWMGGPVALPRGRATRETITPTITFQCASLEELEDSLRSHLSDRPASLEHATCGFTIWAGASFAVILPRDAQESSLPGQLLASPHTAMPAAATFVPRPPLPGGTTSLSITQALTPMLDEKRTAERQRAITKTIIAAMQRVDGYRYSFHNSWKSKEEGAWRFSYYCNDSLLNKDRVANGKAGTAGKSHAVDFNDCTTS